MAEALACAAAPRHVLFLCVANSARSQMAEGIARALAPEGVRVSSAGSEPTSLRPEAVEALREIGIDISGHRSKGMDEVERPVDAVVTLCAEEVCPAWLGPALRVHWGLPDPAAVTPPRRRGCRRSATCATSCAAGSPWCSRGSTRGRTRCTFRCHDHQTARAAKRILWVDDEIDLLRPHLLFLQARGYHVDAISNGDDALALLRDNPYDLVLLDEQMPGRRGLEVLEILRREDPHARVVMVTKSEEDHTMTEAIGRRVDDYLVKPTSPRQVLSVVTRILEGSSIRQQQVAQDFAARFPRLSMLAQDAATPDDFASVFTELTDWHLRLEGAGEQGLLDTVRSLMTDLRRDFGTWVVKRVSALDAGRGGPARAVGGPGGALPPALAGRRPGVLRGPGLHAPGPVAGHDAAARAVLRDRGVVPLLDPPHRDALRAQRDLQRHVSRPDREAHARVGGTPATTRAA